jgi:hypothetical protein
VTSFIPSDRGTARLVPPNETCIEPPYKPNEFKSVARSVSSTFGPAVASLESSFLVR